MGLCLAAHTTARSKLQPLPPTDFSLQITDLMCESVSPMQRVAPTGGVSEPHATHGPHEALQS